MLYQKSCQHLPILNYLLNSIIIFVSFKKSNMVYLAQPSTFKIEGFTPSITLLSACIYVHNVYQVSSARSLSLQRHFALEPKVFKKNKKILKFTTTEKIIIRDSTYGIQSMRDSSHTGFNLRNSTYNRFNPRNSANNNFYLEN